MFAGVEQLVDHVAVLDHRGVDHAGHAGRVAGELHYALEQDLHACLALNRAAGALPGLRVVHDADVGTQLPAVWSLPPQPEDRAGEPAAHDDRTAGRRSVDVREHQRVFPPLDVRSLAGVRLRVAPLRLPLQGTHGMAHFRKVFVEHVVVVELGADGVDRFGREVALGCEDGAEGAVAVEHGPQQRELGDRALGKASVDRIDEPSAAS